MLIRFCENGKPLLSVFPSDFIPLVGDEVVIADIGYNIQSRKVDYGRRVIYIEVIRIENGNKSC